jgi:hypothetical protein
MNGVADRLWHLGIRGVALPASPHIVRRTMQSAQK